eukprot:3832696-Pyramimonas_sp.AAC.1
MPSARCPKGAYVCFGLRFRERAVRCASGVAAPAPEAPAPRASGIGAVPELYARLSAAQARGVAASSSGMLSSVLSAPCRGARAEAACPQLSGRYLIAASPL